MLKRHLIMPPTLRNPPAGAGATPPAAAATPPAAAAAPPAAAAVPTNVSQRQPAVIQLGGDALAMAVRQVLAERQTQGAQANQGQGQGAGAQGQGGGQAPAFHDNSRRGGWTRHDFDLMALDNGMPRDRMDVRQASIERGQQIQADVAQNIGRDDDGRAVPMGNLPAYARQGSGGQMHVRKRQFTEMRKGVHSRNGKVDVSRLGEAGVLADETIGLRFSCWLAYMIGHDGNARAAFQSARRDGADPLVIRALGESTVSAGGASVPEVLIEDYIELLYNASVYLQAGPVRMPAPGGNLSIPRVTAGGSATWLGENTNITASAPTFGQVKVDLKYLANLVPLSNRLIRHSPMAAEGIVRDDMIANAGVTVDSACIRGAGTAFTPVGMKNQAQTVTTANVTANVANVTVDLVGLQTSLFNLKIKLLRGHYFLSPRGRGYLLSARDSNNNRVWRDEMIGGTLEGFPFGVTQNIPITLGGGASSEVYLADMIHEVFAEGVGDDALRVESRDGVAYHDGSSVVAAFSQDQTVVRLIQGVDRVSRQGGNNIALLQTVPW